MNPTIPINYILLYGEHSSLRTHDRSSDISNWIGAPYYYYLWLNPLVSMSPTMYSSMEFFCFMC